MKRKLLKFTLFVFLLMNGVAYAQTVSTTDQVLGESSIGNEILVPINSQDISSSYGDIITATIRVEYNENVLDFVEYTNLNPGFPSGDLSISVNPAGEDGEVQVNIEHDPFTGFTWPDGKMFDLKFVFAGGDAEFLITTAEFLASDFSTNNATIIQGSITGGNPTNIITSGSWSTATNWSLGVVPNSYHDVLIQSGSSKGLVTLSGTASAFSVRVQDDGQFTQNSGSVLTTQDDFIVESGGSFIQDGTVNTPPGAKKASRIIGAWESASATGDGWHLISSPVDAQAIDPEFTGPDSYDFYGWDEPNQMWRAEGDGLTDTDFGVGKGYLVAYETEHTYFFSGDFNTSDVTGLTVTNSGTDDYYGFTLLGNPYPSALEWATGDWSLGNIQTTAYAWDESDKAYNPIGENGIIPPINGFMVYTPSATETLTIPEAARVHDGTDWYKNEEEKLVLVAHDPSNESAQEHTIKFNANATVDYDLKHDAVYLSGYAPDLYSKGGDKNLMVNALPSVSFDTEIPLTFVKNEDSEEYIIELAENSTNEEVFLTDLKTNETISLTNQQAYEFTAEEGDMQDRFELKFTTVGIDDQSKNAPKVYAVNNKLVFENLKQNTTVTVYNMNGQSVYSKRLDDKRVEKLLDIPDGIYMVRMQSGNEVVNEKIIIK